ncbi:MAG TPA: thioredoxin reductase, partial [Candidatus Bathyarchaeota archaeon]|nr:thioredoxin reductase [Candidatus Bathyarchaeota archaeon]
MGFRLSLPTAPPSGERFDLVIVGAGPAGLTAALYAARFGLKAVVIGEEIGGALADAGEVDDYPGVMSIQGPDLAKKFETHVKKYKVPIVRNLVKDIEKEGEFFRITLANGIHYLSKAVIIAVGSKRRTLNVPGEAEFKGRGVSYCAPCDAPLFKDKVTAVVGGGNAALQAALLLTIYSPKVYLIHRREQFRAFPVYVDLVRNNPKIELVLDSVVEEIGGGKTVEWVRIRNVKTGEEKRLEISGIIIEIGSEPPKDFFKKLDLRTDEKGYIIVGPGQETNIKGIYAAGDCTASPHKKKFDQIVTAAAEGAVAALSVYEQLK